MKVNSYLTQLAKVAIIRDLEKLNINRSIAAIQKKLNAHFGTQLDRHFVFGSYARGTILPRSMDTNSDIDYMIVFNDSDLRPQSYLDRLRKFVEINYKKSDIGQSNPTIVLSLNHIKFELVPAVESWFSGLQIPAKSSDYADWVSTDPTDFNDSLINANKQNKNLTKPLIRLLKYWNASNGYVYESYELEKYVVDEGFYMLKLYGDLTLENMLYSFIEAMSWEWGTAKWRIERIQRAQFIVSELQDLQNSNNELIAANRIRKLLPPIAQFSELTV